MMYSDIFNYYITSYFLSWLITVNICWSVFFLITPWIRKYCQHPETNKTLENVVYGSAIEWNISDNLLLVIFAWERS